MINIENSIVAKFGGTSLANSKRFMVVANIIKEDPRRMIIVPSAPGKDKDSLDVANHEKITDLLIDCGKSSFMNYSFNDSINTIETRFLQIANGLRVGIKDDLEEVKSGLSIRRETAELSIAWAASRGEWLSGKILSKYLRAEFIDAGEIMKFYDSGVFNEEESYQLIAQRVKGSNRFLIPGFYGKDGQGRIRIFPRGGSDTTGSHLAAALNVSIYENWTDVDGVKTADPAIVPQARTISYLNYEEMAELGILGAKVLHPSAIGPVWERGTPVHIRNTFNPRHRGTWIGFLSNRYIRAGLNKEKIYQMPGVV